MALPPPKVKALLEEIKTSFLDGSTKCSFESVLKALLAVEVLQRGVLCDLDKIWDAVVDVCGKVLVDSLPKPLLAGSCVIAGRLAEKAAYCYQDPNAFVPKKAVDRADQIGDQRFQILFKVNGLNELLFIAEGFYYRASSFQPDAPPIWKRAWDVTLARNNNVASWESVVAVQNLRRIVQAKGNEKRVSELCLNLTECALSSCEVEQTAVHELFLALYRPVVRYDPKQVVSIAQEALSSFQGDEDMLFLLLRLRTCMSEEDADLHAATEDAFQKAKNRQLETSRETLWNKLRQEHLSELKVDKVLEAAILVRDELSVSHERRDEACGLITSMILPRGLERCRSIALSKASDETVLQVWAQLASFILPILSFKIESIQMNILQEESARICPCIEWMTCCINSHASISSDHFAEVLSILRRGSDRLSKDMKSDEQIALRSSDAAVSSQVDVRIQRRQDLESAMMATQAFVSLVQDDPIGLGAMASGILDRKVAIYSSTSVQSIGLGFLDFLICWNGLLTNPWSSVTLKESRMLMERAKMSLEEAKQEWGRRNSSLEFLLTLLGEAEAECLAFPGLHRVALARWRTIEENVHTQQGLLSTVLQAKCKAGFVVLSNLGHLDLDSSEEGARNALRCLSDMQSKTSHGFYLWRSVQVSGLVCRYLVSSFRRLVANTLVQQGQVDEAGGFLEEAAREAPNDSVTATDLGVFRLRQVAVGAASTSTAKVAQVELLKAAKLDSSKPTPFALLGYWYEKFGDKKRAVGCYSRSLMLDATHPVAGRGILRLVAADFMTSTVERAISAESPLVGWAWASKALQKVADGEDELAIVSFLKASRCRDIACPHLEQLGVFLSNPLSNQQQHLHELTSCLSELAATYRRRGRFTAALRTFLSAIESSGNSVSYNLLCDCAQVELDLGHLLAAKDHFEAAMGIVDIAEADVATHGFGVAMLSLANQHNESGKSGVALEHLQAALESCLKIESRKNTPMHKLLGDIYTFASSLPPRVFSTPEEKLNLMEKGESQYLEAVSVAADITGNATADIVASLRIDVGINQLLRAHHNALYSSSTLDTGSKVVDLFEAAASNFRLALESSPLHQQGWCGLGCAVASRDPILAQHAFCRVIELDPQHVDAFCNLAFLFTNNGAFKAGAKASDAVTQIADTPMMWINRALILERLKGPSVSDAFRASIQAGKKPEAMLGLALSRRSEDIFDSFAFATEYAATTSTEDLYAVLLSGLTGIEYGVQMDGGSGDCLVEKGKERLREATVLLESRDQKVADGILETKLIGSITEVPVDDSVIDAASEEEQIVLSEDMLKEEKRGDLWLQWAQEQLVKGDEESAGRAAMNARTILLQRYGGKPTAAHPNPVSSADVADALFLASSFGDYTQVQTDDGDNLTLEQIAMKRIHDLRMAYKLNPHNDLVYEALRELESTAASVA